MSSLTEEFKALIKHFQGCPSLFFPVPRKNFVPLLGSTGSDFLS